MRHAFSLYTRPDSPFWWWSATIGAQRVRGFTAQPKDAEHREAATREAGVGWLAACAAHGAHVDAAKAGIEADTLTLVARYLDGALAARARKRGPRYAAQIEADLGDYVIERFPLVSQLTAPAWRQWMDECHRTVRLRSIQRITSSANLFLAWCAEQGHIPAKPTLPYPASDEVAAETADRRAFTRAERDAFLLAMKGLDLRAWRIYTVLLYTGLRKSGLERMQARWIDWSSGFVTFPARSLKDGRRPRTFYLRPEARAAVRDELAWVLELASARLSPPPTEVVRLDRLVFGPFDYDQPHGGHRGLFWQAVRAAGIEDTHGLTAHHVTRHTACTIAGNEGASLADLMAMGGWSSPQMACRYLHVDADAARRAVEKL